MSSSIKNYLYNVAYKVFALIVPLLTAPYLARVIGADGIGAYSYTHSIAYIFTIIAKLGVVNYGSRCIARNRDNREIVSRLFSEIYFLQVFTTAVSLLGYAVLLKLYSRENLSLFLINGICIIGIFFDIDWLFYGVEDFKSIALRNVIVKILTTISIFLFVRQSDDLILYTFILASSEVVRYVALWKGIRKHATIAHVGYRNTFSHFPSVFILFIPLIATSLYRVASKIMLGYMDDLFSTGIYESADKIVYLCLGFVTALEAVMMPKSAYLLQTDRTTEFQRSLHISFVFVVALTSAMSFGLVGIAKNFVPLFYGPDFTDCISVLSLLAISLIGIGWANVIRTQYIVPLGRDRIYVFGTIIGLVVVGILNVFFIPLWSVGGAAIGTTIAEFCVAIYLSVAVHRELPLRGIFVQVIPFVIIGLIMALFLRLIGSISSVPSLSILLFQLIFGVFFYVGASCLYLFFSDKMLFYFLVRKVQQVFIKLF